MKMVRSELQQNVDGVKCCWGQFDLIRRYRFSIKSNNSRMLFKEEWLAGQLNFIMSRNNG